MTALSPTMMRHALLLSLKNILTGVGAFGSSNNGSASAEHICNNYNVEKRE